MCLYQTKIQNPHYLVNEKNLGDIPKPKDYRHLYINTSCGWCSECRKEIANNWRIRLMEEWREKRDTIKGQFVNLSFSPDAIKKLEKDMITKQFRGIGKGEIDVNLLAAYAIRMWTERWRKTEKKAPRHWLITELGHENSERLHLHGIIWTNDRLKIKETWQYGNVTIGEYVNIRTMNYITKYITKIDKHHKGYKQRIMTSKGMGLNYIYTARGKEHVFRGEQTKTYYNSPEGYKYALPKYYKNKLWNEEQRQELWTIALNKNTIRIDGNEYDKNKLTLQELDKILQSARERNKAAGYGDNQTNNKRWIITEAMKMHYNELINYDKTKMVKSTIKREHERTIYNESEELDKTRKVDKELWGEYQGNTTKAERNYNELIREARKKKKSVREVRLEKKGIMSLIMIKKVVKVLEKYKNNPIWIGKGIKWEW